MHDRGTAVRTTVSYIQVTHTAVRYRIIYSKAHSLNRCAAVTGLYLILLGGLAALAWLPCGHTHWTVPRYLVQYMPPRPLVLLRTHDFASVT